MARDPANYKRWREANKDRIKANSRTWRKANPAGNRQQHLQRKYGIDLAQYQRMYDEQRGLCAICHRPAGDGKKLVVDHCHSTGHVRALLCHPCNVGIGMLGDNSDRIHAAAAYLDSFNEY